MSGAIFTGYDPIEITQYMDDLQIKSEERLDIRKRLRVLEAFVVNKINA